MAAIATATLSSSGGVAARAEATGSLRVNAALQDAAEKLGAISAAREAVARLGQLATASARDKSESPGLLSAASDAVMGEFGAQITLLIHQEKLDAPRGAILSPNAKAVWGGH